MKHIAFSSAILFYSLFFPNARCLGQEEQPPAKRELKNTVSYNLSNPLIFGFKTIVIGYERVLGKHQSIAVDIGQISLPSISILPNSIRANSETKEKGYKIAVDYRFYPANENKYNAPRGVYIAPYVTYNYFDRKKSFDIDTSTTNIPVDINVSTDFELKISSIGFELGYQFIFWRRVALDLILIGPGISKYSITTTLDTNLKPDDESELFKAINDALAEKIPGYSYVIKPEEFNKTGTSNTTSVGFRYLVHLGVRF